MTFHEHLVEEDCVQVLADIARQAKRELQRQYAKWGHQDHAVGDWWLIVSEEFGELAKATLEGNQPQIAEEATHLVACIARFVDKATRHYPSRLTSNGWTAPAASDDGQEG